MFSVISILLIVFICNSFASSQNDEIIRLNNQLNELNQKIDLLKEEKLSLLNKVDRFEQIVTKAAQDVTTSIGNFVDSATETLTMTKNVNEQTQVTMTNDYQSVQQNLNANEQKLETLEQL
mmetsp:Transcript_20883/g.35581  ORF Transcript_20883/g.35581 Transcript_20883/m.35581 type:complete len:121 (-) Transcript_20883:47-409(-)